MAFIYKITNTLNQKSYIGKTERTIAIRWQEHKRHYQSLPDIPLYKAFNKYGIENFIIEQIEQCDSNIINEREQYWIKFYNTYQDGYNATLGGDGSLLTYEENELETIIARYKNGERLDVLCKEFHHDYNTIKQALQQRGININTTAGPMKLAKKIYAYDPTSNKLLNEYESISAAARSICEPGKNYKAIANHISRYKNTNTISHGYLWKTERELMK